MPAGGELAALFARRAKVADGNVVDKECSGGALAAAAQSPPTPTTHARPPATTQRLPPKKSSPPPTPSRSPASRARSPAVGAAAEAPSTAGDPVKAANLVQNDELKVEFESRDLKAGIPTPSFLLNARANLKKSGEKAASAGGCGSETNPVASSGVANVKTTAASPSYRKSNSSNSADGGGRRCNNAVGSCSSESVEAGQNHKKGLTEPASGYTSSSDRFIKTKTASNGFGPFGGHQSIESEVALPTKRSSRKSGDDIPERNTGAGKINGGVVADNQICESETTLAKNDAFKKSHSGSFSKKPSSVDRPKKRGTPKGASNISTNHSSDSDFTGRSEKEFSASGFARGDLFDNKLSDFRPASTCSSSVIDTVEVASFGHGKASSFHIARGAKGKFLAASTCSSNDIPTDEAVTAAAIVSIVANKGRRERSGSDGDRASSGATVSKMGLAARRSRMVASRGMASASSAPPGGSKQSNAESAMMQKNEVAAAKDRKKASPAQLRREKLLARVRASHSGIPKASTTSAAGKEQTKMMQKSIDTDLDAPFETAIISPTRDEFEVMFADSDFSFPNPADPNEGSIDSITNEIHQVLNKSTSTATAGSAITMPTNNVKPKAKMATDAVSEGGPKANQHATPTKVSRLHNASTPKIRGNGIHKRENFEEGGREEGSNANNANSVPTTVQQSPNHSGDRSPQEPHQQLTPSRRSHHPQNQQHQSDIPQAYPLRQSPSQMSQMSGITTPSCFPQEFHVPSMTHPQQPLLVGGPIHETYETSSTGSSPQIPAGDHGTGAGLGGQQRNIIGATSAFSSGIENENRRLREQLGAMQKRLDEKDAIISQLMKRIGDLESMNAHQFPSPFTIDSTPAHQSHGHGPSPLPFSDTDQSAYPQVGLLTTPSNTSATSQQSGRSGQGQQVGDLYGASSPWDKHNQPPSSPWDHNQPLGSQGNIPHLSSSFYSATSRASGSLDTISQQRSGSVDTESQNLSIPSSPMPSAPGKSSPPRGSRQQREHSQRGQNQSSSKNIKMSPSTIGTSSTASVTTANSSRSNGGNGGSRKHKHQQTPSRSKSATARARQSPHRRGGGPSREDQADDRKFVC